MSTQLNQNVLAIYGFRWQFAAENVAAFCNFLYFIYFLGEKQTEILQ